MHPHGRRNSHSKEKIVEEKLCTPMNHFSTHVDAETAHVGKKDNMFSKVSISSAIPTSELRFSSAIPTSNILFQGLLCLIEKVSFRLVRASTPPFRTC